MRLLVLLFHERSYDILGECLFHDEKHSTVRLNSSGNSCVGDSLRRFYSDECSVFHISEFREWACDEGVLLIAFPAEYASVWNEIATLPLSSRDRYAFAFACSFASPRQREKWIEMLRRGGE